MPTSWSGPRDLDGFDGLGDIAVDERETAMARQLIAALEADFEPGRYTDSYREALLELIERKASGDATDTVAAPAPTSDTVVDLMAALEASVAAAKEARKRHPTAAGENAHPRPRGGSRDEQRGVGAFRRDRSAGRPEAWGRSKPRRAVISGERNTARAGATARGPISAAARGASGERSRASRGHRGRPAAVG